MSICNIPAAFVAGTDWPQGSARLGPDVTGPPRLEPSSSNPAASKSHQNDAQSESMGSLADHRPDTVSYAIT
jgi:hypothetical protein